MNYQPNKEYSTSPDTIIMYKEMARRQKEDQSKVKEIIEKRKVRMEAEEGSREAWAVLSYDEQVIRKEKLESVCNELIHHHSDYSSFKTAVVQYGEEPGMIRIHWNGSKHVDGWGSIDREFPEADLPIILKRYQDRLRLQTKDDEV